VTWQAAALNDPQFVKRTHFHVNLRGSPKIRPLSVNGLYFCHICFNTAFRQIIGCRSCLVLNETKELLRICAEVGMGWGAAEFWSTSRCYPRARLLVVAWLVSRVAAVLTCYAILLEEFRQGTVLFPRRYSTNGGTEVTLRALSSCARDAFKWLASRSSQFDRRGISGILVSKITTKHSQ
jgi:hypothetical protein